MRTRFQSHQTDSLSNTNPTWYHNSHNKFTYVLAAGYSRLEFDPSAGWQNLTSQNQLSASLGIGQYFTDTVTSNFRTKRRQGKVINNPATNTRLSVSGSFGFVDARYWPKYSITGPDGTYGKRLYAPIKPPFPGYDENSVAVRRYSNGYTETVPSRQLLADEAYNLILEKRTSLLVTLAELKKTSLTVSGIFKDALKMVRGFRRLAAEVAKPKTLRDDLSRQWLRYRYGLRPMMYELISIIDALNSKYQKRGSVRRTEAIQLAENAPSPYYEPFNVSGVGTTALRIKVDWSQTSYTDNRVGHLYLTNPSKLLAFRRFGVDDLLGTAWELVPYSFIVDWFVDVSAYLQKVQREIISDDFIELVSSYTSVRTDTFRSYSVVPTWDNVDLWNSVYGDSRLNVNLDAGDYVFPTDPDELQALIDKYIDTEFYYVQPELSTREMKYIREPFSYVPSLSDGPRVHGLSNFLKSLPKLLDVAGLVNQRAHIERTGYRSRLRL